MVREDAEDQKIIIDIVDSTIFEDFEATIDW
jgi:hypothetical protein